MNDKEINDVTTSFVCTCRCPTIQSNAITVLFEGKVLEIRQTEVLLDDKNLVQLIDQEYFS